MSKKPVVKIGDKIRDIEDGDCYFEGYVTKVKSNGELDEYIITRVLWNDIEYLTSDEDKVIGTEVTKRWWYYELI